MSGLRIVPAREAATDAALLERVAANLIENGVRYNRPGGFVEVRTRAGVGSVEVLSYDRGHSASRPS